MTLVTLYKKGTGEARDFDINIIMSEPGWYLTREQALAAGENAMLPRGHNGIMSRAPFIKSQSFWCTCCDAKVVDADDETSGHFYVLHGHARTMMANTTNQNHISGEYSQFVIALCSECEVGHFIHTEEKE